jgi:hypothetical protein
MGENFGDFGDFGLLVDAVFAPGLFPVVCPGIFFGANGSCWHQNPHKIHTVSNIAKLLNLQGVSVMPTK